jgi:predicted 2-oxoglutarate/Fe(II)-dependent dioxygenase YbiX
MIAIDVAQECCHPAFEEYNPNTMYLGKVEGDIKSQHETESADMEGILEYSRIN